MSFKHLGRHATHNDAKDFCDNVKAKFPNTKSATSFMVAYSFDQNGKQAYSYDNDGENGAGQRMIRMMEMIGIKNVCVIIARHYNGKMFGARWSIMQSQMSRIAKKMGYSIPSNMNIHKFFPRVESASNQSYNHQHSRYPSYDMDNSYGHEINSNDAWMSDNQRELLRWQQMVFNKLATISPRHQPSASYNW